jgi:hypothetical protein
LIQIIPAIGFPRILHSKSSGVSIMSLESILFLGLVIGALVLFASVLAYGDWATRQAMRDIAGPAPSVKPRKSHDEQSVKDGARYKAAA